VIAAGSRGSDTEISSQPSTCDESASSSSHACDSSPGTQSMSPIAIPASAEKTAADSVASNSGPAGWRRSLPDWRRIRMNAA
jgi:hypothetical protein